MFGYEFVDLDKAATVARRQSLDLYASIAQWSILPILALIQLSFLLQWTITKCAREAPRSPHPQPMTIGRSTWVNRTRESWTKFRWWADEPLRNGWFTRGETMLAGVWTVWLLFLCVYQTGNDYLHLTKRFGIVAASQLPLHYLLAMRSAYSPIQLLTRLSYERVIAVHELLGKILTFIFALHASFYFNFFVQKGWLSKRIRDIDVITGSISFLMFATMSTTALSFLRHWNYRVFYTTHILLALIVIDLLIFHVSHIRVYVFEMFSAFLLLQLLRQALTRQYSGTIDLVPGTNLVQVVIPLPTEKAARRFKPGQHVHLSRPLLGKVSLTSAFAMRYRTNPFTIASVPQKDRQILLVARALDGNTKYLADIARSLRSEDTSEKSIALPLTIEGPYGAAGSFPDFKEFDRVLLVAGGVGGTFTVPIYRNIVEAGREEDAVPVVRARVKFVWAVRRLAETKWALPDHKRSTEPSLKDLELYITRKATMEEHGGDDHQGLMEEFELAESETFNREDEHAKNHGWNIEQGRPSIPRLVEEAFTGSTGRVAVVTCGPQGMVAELRQQVKKWVHKGRDVFWHAEPFGL
ncbi:ferric reductase like transmembrane component-domain-containing protein [Phyllosticta citrichinensis]|uniref:ferric-chelate reductase (NADPH) n=1 Tax=Phyllosticta citrichinensis TaxID=1130410 RepID=A0ABR1XXB4_9PEZI